MHPIEVSSFMEHFSNFDMDNSSSSEYNQTSSTEVQTRIQDSSHHNHHLESELSMIDEVLNEQNHTIASSDVNNISILIDSINNETNAEEIEMSVDILDDELQHSSVSDSQITTNGAIINTPVQMDEAVGGSDPTYNYEIYRLLSYSDSHRYNLKSHLAKCGFYHIQNHNISQCQFCKIRIDETNIITIKNQKHTCEKINNIAIPQDTSNFRYEINRLISFLKVEWNKQVNMTNILKLILKICSIIPLSP